MKLPVNGQGDYQAWCSLLTSSGDKSRAATACDTSTPLTAAKAASLAAAGYKVVGRYLVNAKSAGALNKKLQPGELAIIKGSGLRVYPIYQTYGGGPDYFKSEQGVSDAREAIAAARLFGFPAGAVLYFAIDFDATDDDVTSSIVPHFEGIRAVFDALGNQYRVAVYGSRNPCSRLAERGLTTSSMVLGMSNGYSGNLGFPMPNNWAWDQFATVTVGTGTGAITVDQNGVSGADGGHQPTEVTGADVVLPAAATAQVQADVTAAAGDVDDDLGSNVTIRSAEQAVIDVLALDTHFTAVAAQFGMRKALVQTVAFWERWREHPDDPVVDIAVQEQLEYKVEFQEWFNGGGVGSPPLNPGLPEDSSTGFSQIFGAVGIKCRNWAIESSLMAGEPHSATSPQDMLFTWSELRTNVMFNVATAAAVLWWGATDVGVANIPRFELTEMEVKSTLARFNGTSAEATEYGVRTWHIYQVFEAHNAQWR